MAIIKCKNVSLGYEGAVAVSGLDFTVNKGDYLCIVGENGSGKSTLIKGLLKIIKPLNGEITAGDGLKAGEIGYLPQQTAAQKDFPASVYEVVLSGRLSKCGLRPFYSKKDKVEAEKNLARMNMLEMKNRCYRELSGGQQQRVLLARALCATSKLLLLDEPVSGLDPVVTQELYSLIKKLNAEMGITIIMVSHDIRSAMDYASHILHLTNEQAFFGSAEDYAKSEIGGHFMGGVKPD